jgi:hypothetical protein
MARASGMTRGLDFACSHCGEIFPAWSTVYVPSVGPGRVEELCGKCYAAWKAENPDEARRAA